ncbi:hypothetical protein ACFXPS_33830 [Nocardia sp. NPDC059091]
MHDGAQRLVQIQAGGDDEHGVDEPIHAVVHIHHLRDALLHLGEKFT